MPCLLIVETSAQICSLALSVDGRLVLDKTYANYTKKASHASLLGVFALEAVKYARENDYKIDAVAVSAGPGSYTGLRIGISEAKGLCYGFGIPLIAVATLKIIVFQAIHSLSLFPPHLIYCPVIDTTHGMEIFAALYDVNLNEIRSAQVDIIDNNSYKEYLEKYTVMFIGNNLDKCDKVIQSPNALFLRSAHPTAGAMIHLAEIAFKKKEFVNTAYFEPLYLKKFRTTIYSK